MLIFSIALKSPEISKDWDLVVKRCQRTLISCSQQTTDNFRIILVCNKAPAIPDGVRNLKIIEEYFPAPKSKDEQRQDKYRKHQRALIELRDSGPFYWMKVDADDCVSERLACFLRNQNINQSWIINQGYIYKERSKFCYYEKKIFHERCGTSSIIWFSGNSNLPNSMDQSCEEIEYLSVPHTKLTTMLSKTSQVFGFLPYPGVIYCVGSNENLSGFSGVEQFKSWKWRYLRAINTRFLGTKIKKAFNFEAYEI